MCQNPEETQGFSLSLFLFSKREAHLQHRSLDAGLRWLSSWDSPARSDVSGTRYEWHPAPALRSWDKIRDGRAETDWVGDDYFHQAKDAQGVLGLVHFGSFAHVPPTPELCIESSPNEEGYSFLVTNAGLDLVGDFRINHLDSLLGAPGLTTRSKKLLGAPGIATNGAIGRFSDPEISSRGPGVALVAGE